MDKKMQSIDFVGSVLVVRGDKVVFEKQYGDANAARKRQNDVN
ncbi:hypothetical protein [Furfurilactobacillus sp.]|nr:hypothetical protein [Furfurilactobacillus sp.]